MPRRAVAPTRPTARPATRAALRLTAIAVLAVVTAARAGAHGGGLSAASRESLTVPNWLFLTTGGAAVGASFLLATMVTDRTVVARLHEPRRRGRSAGVTVLGLAGRVLGLAGLVAVLVAGFLGPTTPTANLAVLLVWVGWWAGLVAVAYLFVDAWPALNPWRTIAGALPSLDVAYPERLGAWPSVAGLLALVWLEVVSPLTDAPAVLAAVVLAYTVVTLAGVVAVGPGPWFRRVDPIARAFRYYGRVAPLTVADGRLGTRLPGTALAETRLVDGLDEVAFVVALLWVTTFDGLVATPAWTAAAERLAALGVPGSAAALLALLGGYAVFLGAYALAVRLSRSIARTHRSPATLARRFAPPLLAIAAGYHFAHYLGYLLSNLPLLASAVTAPLAAGPVPEPFYLPGWFGAVALTSVLLGHVLAIWVAHATAYDLFPGRLQAVRSQYPFIAVMVLYTTTSLWIVSQPTVAH